MEYTMQSGMLSEKISQRTLAKIKNSVVGPAKKIYTDSGVCTLKTEIQNIGLQGEPAGSVRSKRYMMVDETGKTIASGQPDYAAGDNPDTMGWPVCRLPRVDHVTITTRENKYQLTMHSSREYTLYDNCGQELLSISHKGITGGWNVHDSHGFPPEILCGIFAFCRYIEQENEFLIV